MTFVKNTTILSWKTIKEPILIIFLGSLVSLYVVKTSGHYFGYESVPIYFFIGFLLVFFSAHKILDSKIERQIIILSYFYKSFFALLMTYLLINRYGYGDFGTYYDTSIILSNSIKELNFDIDIPFSNAYSVSWFIGVLLIILPKSIYGLGLLWASISTIGYTLFYKSLVNTLIISMKFKKILLFLIFFLPSIQLYSSYVGKDALVLLLLGLILYWLSHQGNKRKMTIYLCLLFAMLAIYIIRPYQFLIVFASLSLALIMYLLRAKSKIYYIYTILLIPIIYYLGYYSLSIYGDFFESGFSRILDIPSIAYVGGSLMLDPYPFPLTFLQIFRPFPWEINNYLAMYISIENLIIMTTIIYLLLKRGSMLSTLKYIYSLTKKPYCLFLLTYVIITIILFSYDPNMGDLARRRIYIVPYLMGILVAKGIK